ncbi:hypothetical protein RKE29_11375 [Streptomyces sp. B1866]|uniref:hypothetical protein n=1 Tax=Streptomyces sp. B1866 TaxID=3075431 RepID=UPI002891F45C|nr:hypothetical protein [Streptomyces sp. B1866]MDT3397238.1 hypothetical protein [Streptomyces sp. B1866]
MAITDDVRKTLTDPTPLYFVAGTADLAAQKLKEVPALVEKFVAEAPDRLSAVRKTDPKAVQDRVAQRAKDAQDKLGELFGALDNDLATLREQVQEAALQGVGRAAELAVKARERYDEVAEHGQAVVRQWRGEAADEVVDVAVAIEPEGREAAAEPAGEGGAGAAGKAGAGKSGRSGAAARKSASGARPAARKAAPRKTAARKTAPKSEE